MEYKRLSNPNLDGANQKALAKYDILKAILAAKGSKQLKLKILPAQEPNNIFLKPLNAGPGKECDGEKPRQK